MQVGTDKFQYLRFELRSHRIELKLHQSTQLNESSSETLLSTPLEAKTPPAPIPGPGVLKNFQ